MVSVAVYAEGPTEWQVARKLWKRNILNGGEFIHHSDKYPEEMIIGEVSSSLNKLVNANNNGKTGYLINPPTDRVLLMFDQEKMSSPSEVKSRIEDHFGNFDIDFEIRQHNDFSNIFTGKISKEDGENLFAIHVSDKLFCSTDGNKDFDGYILELLNDELGRSIVQGLLTDRKLTISPLRRIIESNQDMTNTVHKLGGQEIPSLMEEKEWSIRRSKTIIYSYITALQIEKSHVWFCEKVIDKADEENLKRVFSSLIAAWDELCRGG